jgi:hypothetical protein
MLRGRPWPNWPTAAIAASKPDSCAGLQGASSRGKKAGVQASPEWEKLRSELERLMHASRAFNAYVLDAWDNVWCSAHGYADTVHEDLTELVHDAARHRGISLTRGGKLDTYFSGRAGHAYLRTYGSCYVLLLRFSGPFDHANAREITTEHLPRLEALTLALPPPDGPGSDGSEAASTA